MSKRRLKEALNLINAVFPDEQDEPPGEELPASLHLQKYRDYLLKTEISYVKYWVAVDDCGLAGVIGLSCCQKDESEAFWLGWFCVEPNSRRKGIGGRLLRFAIKKTKNGGKKFLRLNTSTDPNESDARRLYEKYGFKLVGQERYLHENDEKLYYELKL